MSILSYFSKSTVWLFSLWLLLIVGCIEKTTNADGTPRDYKLNSEGGNLEIIAVMDSVRWNGDLGEALRSVYMEAQPGLPRGEIRFKVLSVSPRNFKRFLKRHHSVIFLTLLDDNSEGGKLMQSFFTKESLNEIKNDGEKFMIGRKDEFAKDQKVLYLFGETQNKLIDRLKANKQRLQDYFYEAERARTTERLMGSGTFTNEPMSKLIKKETGLSLEIPDGYGLAKKDSNFTWIRHPGKPYDRNIWVSYGKYTSEEMFSDEQIIRWRNHFGYKSMNDSTLELSYMNTQDDVIPIVSRQTTFGGKFAREYRGLWKLKNNTRGGPFLGYAFVDEKTNRFYYVETFVYAPSEKQRNVMFELEAVLHTIKY